MPERPPPGYPVTDRPLPHNFAYQFALACNDETKNKFQATFLRTSTIDAAPSTINVHTRNSGFLEDKGPLIVNGSRVQFISIITRMKLTKAALITDDINALNIYSYNIHGAFEDSWTPADVISTTTTAQLLHVVSDVTNEDVVPETDSLNLDAQSHPLSNITATEVFGTYNLSTDDTPENTTTDANILNELFDAKHYYTNGGKLNSLMGSIRRTTLRNNKTYMQTFEKKFTPKQCRAANPHMIFSRQYVIPKILDPSQILGEGDIAGTGPYVGFTVQVRFNEWNEEFDQTR